MRKFRFTYLSWERWHNYVQVSRHDNDLSRQLEFGGKLAEIIEQRIHGWNDDLPEAVMEWILEADPTHITSKMLDKVINILAEVWEHGKALAAWYKNKRHARVLKECIQQYRAGIGHLQVA